MEKERFEPSIVTTKLTFQVSTFNLSVIFPFNLGSTGFEPMPCYL